MLELCSEYLSPSKISQSINFESRTCDRNDKQFFQSKQEKLWLFDKARNVLIEKNIDLLDFAKYRSY